MSIKIMQDVWTKSRTKGTHRLLLLAIADNANDDGYAWPGHEYLAKKINMSLDYTRAAIKGLIASTELELISSGSGRTSSQYRVWAGREGAGNHSEGVRTTRQGGRGQPPNHHITVIEPSYLPDGQNGNGNGEHPSLPGEGLLPTTPGAILLFDAIEKEAGAKGRRAAKKFATIAQKDKFLAAENILPEAELKKAIKWALEQGRADRQAIINIVCKWAENYAKKKAPASGVGKHIVQRWTSLGGGK